MTPPPPGVTSHLFSPGVSLGDTLADPLGDPGAALWGYLKPQLDRKPSNKNTQHLFVGRPKSLPNMIFWLSVPTLDPRFDGGVSESVGSSHKKVSFRSPFVLKASWPRSRRVRVTSIFVESSDRPMPCTQTRTRVQQRKKGKRSVTEGAQS